MPELTHTFTGSAYRLNAQGKVNLDIRGAIISGQFRILAANNSGTAGVVIGDGEMPETFYVVPVHECAGLEKVDA